MQKPALKAVIYTRVSTGEQAEHGTSLADQEEACRAKATALGAKLWRGMWMLA
jgi:site-specific DNA recombinase